MAGHCAHRFGAKMNGERTAKKFPATPGGNLTAANLHRLQSEGLTIVDLSDDHAPRVLGAAPYRATYLALAGERFDSALAPAEAAEDRYLELYGFRCMNELMLEEHSLRDRPHLVYQVLRNYLRLDDPAALDVAAMEAREKRLRREAEERAFAGLRKRRSLFPRGLVFRHVLRSARRGVKNRENMRFARTRIYGLVRELHLGPADVQHGLLAACRRGLDGRLREGLAPRKARRRSPDAVSSRYPSQARDPRHPRSRRESECERPTERSMLRPTSFGAFHAASVFVPCPHPAPRGHGARVQEEAAARAGHATELNCLRGCLSRSHAERFGRRRPRCRGRRRGCTG